jgi:hypothetical protein
MNMRSIASDVVLVGPDHPTAVEAAELISRWNPGRTAESVLSALLASYWLGEIELFVLRRPTDTTLDQDGYVYRDMDEDELVLERQKVPWSREECLKALELLHRAGISSSLPLGWFEAHRGSEARAFRELATMKPGAYDLDLTYLRVRHFAVPALVAWCRQQKLQVPSPWVTDVSEGGRSGQGTDAALATTAEQALIPKHRGLRDADAPIIARVR